MQTDNSKKNVAGNNQSDFAGTNPDRYGDPAAENDQDNPINDEEAQNMTSTGDRVAGAEAEKARNKAREGKSEGRDE